MSPRNNRAGERRLASMGGSIVPAQNSGAWAPDLPSVDEYEDVFPISETVSYVLRWGADKYGRPVEFAVIQRLLADGQFRRVAVYDACHGKGLHVHLYDGDDKEIDQHQLRPVRSYEELADGMDYAMERVTKDWQENERRSRRGNGGATAR